ncbi:MAG: GNAT family N-acetyltransferase [Gracilimonas sp.]|uniref:GNAT family N-acetyltransferase n=1 Tax=Gracilimonas sp. TaxID=1974203 RepID=UPI003750DB99|nr:GNAT family N-acetyltransferase [Gracilimonas sp.]
MNIREAKQNELDEILNLFTETISEVNNQDYSLSQIEAWSSGARDKERWLSKIDEQYFLVTEEEGTITGFASITNKGYLDIMFVHKNHQRKGIAKTLITALIDYAKQNQLEEITTEGSVTARPFFEKYGFKVIKKQKVNRKGIEIANYKMKKRL